MPMMRPQTAAQMPPKTTPATNSRMAAGLAMAAMALAFRPSTGIMCMMNSAQE